MEIARSNQELVAAGFSGKDQLRKRDSHQVQQFSLLRNQVMLASEAYYGRPNASK